jgi:CRP/FNR family nitrogen fixation transcriptional regulator
MLCWQGGETAKIVPFTNPERNSASQSVWDILDLTGTKRHFTRNAEIFGEGERADNIYKVVSGAVRTCKLMSDGRRQIGDFYLPGDPFGLARDGVHEFSAEAIGNCVVRVIRRSVFLGHAALTESAGAELWMQALLQLQRAEHHILLLGRKSAQERIAAFLIDMMQRLSRNGNMDLPMSRQDIADYLGLTIETVSRTMTQLERDGLIAMPCNRRIVFRDREALDLMNDRMAA